MKRILPVFLLLLLLGCSRDRDVEPEDITEIVYSYTFGFTGATSIITIDPKKEIFEYYGKPDHCERPITLAEWSSLVEGFDWKKFRKIKSEDEPVCCDIGGVYLKITAGSSSHEASWQLNRPDTTSNVGNLMSRASGRLQHLIKTCP
jgi:hypothetical protein